MQENRNYIIFILGYDLLQKYFSDSIEPECDLVYEKCSKIADDFLLSKYNSNNKSLYDCITDYVRSERYVNFLNSLEEKHIKRLEEWHNSKAETFTDFCKPGDIVEQRIVDYFINSLPPIYFGENFVQAGGAFDHRLDKEDNLVKPIYTTFEKENGNWVYKGNCFRGKNEDMTYADSPINKEFKKVGYIEDSIIDRFTEMKEKLNWKLDLNENIFSKILEKIKEDDELAIILDETIGSAISELKTKLDKEEEEASERE